MATSRKGKPSLRGLHCPRRRSTVIEGKHTNRCRREVLLATSGAPFPCFGPVGMARRKEARWAPLASGANTSTVGHESVLSSSPAAMASAFGALRERTDRTADAAARLRRIEAGRMEEGGM
jgi:hypothetical protein